MDESLTPRNGGNAALDEAHRDQLGPILDDGLAPLFWPPASLDRASAWFGHIPFAQWLVNATCPRVLVELGTHAGVSYSAFCSTVARGNLNTRCFAVDTWKGDDHAGHYPEQIYLDFSRFNDATYGSFSTLLRRTFDDAVEHFADGTIDLLHIDGFHSYEAGSHDFNTWKPKLSDRAIVLFHDTNEHREGFGIWRLWEELKQQFPTFEFLHSHGLGVLCFGNQVHPAAIELCNLDSGRAKKLRERFQAIGERWALDARLRRQSTEIEARLGKQAEEAASLRKQLETTAKERADLLRANDGLKSELESVAHDRNQERADLLRANDGLKSELESVAHDRNQEREAAHKLISTRDAEIAKLEVEKKAYEIQRRELETHLVGLRREKQEFLASTSWRITAPVRAMPARIRAPARLLAKLAWWTITPRLWATRYKYYRNVLAIKRTEGATTPSVAQRSPGPATEQVEARYIRKRIEAQFNSVAIIVPVYNAPQETDECIRSVLRHSDPSVQLIVINDASSDPKIREVLAQYTDLPNVEVVHNETNIGFTRTINRGIELAGSADVVFLNSDTIVTPQWLRNLQFAAYSEDRIATATPFSDNAGAFSAPEIGKKNPIPRWLELDDYARLVTRNSKRHYPKVPTGNGFCMFVRRACIDEVGTLDAETFPRGYGEENDFCMRAGRKGWQHVIDDATLIHHVRSASFGDEKTQLMKDGRAAVDKRFPEYSNRVRSLIDDPIVSAARQRVGEAASIPLQQNGVRPRAVFVISTRTGGTPQTNQDLMEALHDRYEAYLLRCDAKTVEFFQIAGREQILLETVKLEQPLKAFPHASEEYDAIVRQLLIQHQIELVHIRHIAWHSLKLPAICKSLQVPVVFSFHDFYTICPTVKLLDENLQFCGGTCTASLGQCKHELWTDPDFPPLKRNAIKDWQSAMSEMLAHCDSYVTTSHGSRDQIMQIYPVTQKKPFVVITHGRDLQIKNVTTTARSTKEKIRILVPGNIDISKGAGILESLAELDKDGIFEFHLLGRTTIPLTRNFVFHGPYKREEFIQKVEKIRPHFGAILSIWPETFCHTLTEMWACGLPVLALDFGAVAERIRQTGGGWLLANSSPQILFERLQAITQDFVDYSQKVDEVHLWQDAIGRTNSTLWMSQYYDEIYRNLLTRETHVSEGLHRPRVGVVLPGNGPSYPASSHIRVLEKIRDNIRRPVRYDLIQPGDVANESVVGQFNAILVQRTALQPYDLTKFTSACSSSGTKVIFEIDDDLIDMGDRRDLTVNYEAFKQSVKSIAQTADVVIASTPILAGRLRTINRSVVIAENALSERLWFGPIASGLDDLGVPNLQKRASQEIRIVYMGTKTHTADLALLEQPIRVLRSEFPNLRFFTIGITDISENWFENVNIRDKYKPYSNFVPWFRNFAAEMDIAVAPLDDTSFNAAKSPLKFYEYSAAKLCGLYSAVEPYKSAVRSRVTGYLVDNNVEAWTDSLRRAIDRPDEKRQIVARAFDEMLHHHGMKAAAEQLDNIVMDLSAVQSEVKIVGGGAD
ncbi:class I SAM-dependent methyltransferase [Mesorhizobium sp.]|uniref:class I SAM-dependent methyltransferase n=1 Tax=Mesorhizobium sp. TaxID=1871066 RepID=UPI000FE9621B|nr:class I SAM-dependent methyltransferase [Mesorhizobium sp.]RWQ10860.1 MAG: glycosyltransferase [Mesorhizobium sp.]